MFVSAVVWFAIRNGFIASILLDALGIATLGTVFFVVGYWLISHKIITEKTQLILAHFTVTRDSIKQSYHPPQRFFLTNVTVSPMAQAVNDSIIMKNGRLTSSTVAAAIKLKDANQRLRQQTTSTQRSSFL